MLRLNTAMDTGNHLPGRTPAPRNRPLMPGLQSTRLLSRTISRDVVRFNQMPHVTGPIPPESLVLVVSGMASPLNAMNSLEQYLKAKGHQTLVMASPAYLLEGNIQASTEWLTPSIDDFRMKESSKRYLKWVDELANLPPLSRVEFLRRKLQLDDSELGKATAQAVLNLMFNNDKKSKYTALIQAYRDKTREGQQENSKSKLSRFSRKADEVPDKKKTAEIHLSQLERREALDSLNRIAREKLSEQLRPVFLQPAQNQAEQARQWNALQKTIDHVLDQIAPRVVIVGHSMGGFVGMLTLFAQRKDISLVVGLSAPGEKGIDEIPKGTGFLRRLPEESQKKARAWLVDKAPAINQMTAGSLETRKLEADHQPFNSTIVAVGMPEDSDGIVGERHFRMNDSLPGRINVLVTPLMANVLAMNDEKLYRFHQRLGELSPVYKWISKTLMERSVLLRSIAYHSGLVQHQEQYWPRQGDMVRAILEAPKNRHGETDYQNGKPDYPAAIQQIRRVLHPHNSEAVRIHFLTLMEDHFRDARKNKSQGEYHNFLMAYQPITYDLANIAREKQPIRNGVADMAQRLLRQFREADALPENL